MQTPSNATQPSPSWPDTPERLQKARTNYDRFSDLSTRYRDDASLRARLDDGDTADALAALGIDVPDGVRARIVADTPETVHFILPPDPNIVLSDEMLTISAGGKSANTASTIGSVGTFACSSAPSSAGSVGSVGTINPETEA